MRRPRLIGNPVEHWENNGGSYWIHFINALTKSILALSLFLVGIVHSVLPFMFPDLPDYLLKVLSDKHHKDSLFCRETN